MSHLDPLPVYRCRTCGRPATVALVNDRSAVVGYYCAGHGETALRLFRMGEPS
jgi:hypothetical protein